MNHRNAFARSLVAFVALALSACAHGEKHEAGRGVQSTDGATIRAPSQVQEDGYPGMADAMQKRPLVVEKPGSEIYSACLAKYESAPRNGIIRHDEIVLNYNGFHRVPNWVYHQIDAENMKKPSFGRSESKFSKDPKLPDDVAVGHNDYTGSGFDRGHMVPSGDFSYDTKLNKQTFYASNLSPQSPDMNQKAWERLEDQVRKWACGLGKLKVYTGPIYEEGLLPYRLKSCISVPHRFFKVLLAEKAGKRTAIAFIYGQNNDIAKNELGHWKKKVASIDEVEAQTGWDFFADEFSIADQASFEAQSDRQKVIADWDNAGSGECDVARAKAQADAKSQGKTAPPEEH